MILGYAFTGHISDIILGIPPVLEKNQQKERGTIVVVTMGSIPKLSLCIEGATPQFLPQRGGKCVPRFLPHGIELHMM